MAADMEREARRLALDNLNGAVRAAFGRRLDSRRPQKQSVPAPAPEAPAAEPQDVDVEALRSLLEG